MRILKRSAEDAGAELAGGAGAVVLLHLAAVGDGIGDSEVDAPGIDPSIVLHPLREILVDTLPVDAPGRSAKEIDSRHRDIEAPGSPARTHLIIGWRLHHPYTLRHAVARSVIVKCEIEIAEIIVDAGIESHETAAVTVLASTAVVFTIKICPAVERPVEE